MKTKRKVKRPRKLALEGALLEAIMLLITKGLPAGIALLASLKETDYTPAKIRALREGLAPPEEA